MAQEQGACFTSRHHLYWPGAKFAANGLSLLFRQHRFNSVSLPRCQHDRLHDRYKQALMPKESVMLAFLDEAKILEQMGVVLSAQQAVETAVESLRRNRKKYSPARIDERVAELAEREADLWRQMDDLEIIEPRLVLPHLGEIVLVNAA